MSYVKKTCEVLVISKLQEEIKTPISDIQIGHVIKTYDELSEKWSTDVVMEIHKTKLSNFVDFNIELGYEGIGYFSINGNSKFQCVVTSSLLTLIGWCSFFSISHNKPFLTGTPLVNLERNNQVMIPITSQYERIDSIEFIPCQDELVYSLSLKTDYSYVVDNYILHIL